MSITVPLNGTPYTVPEDGDTFAWGAPLTQFFQAIGNEMLQKNTALFTVSQDLDFGTSFGIIVQYLKSHAADIAQSGILRLGNNEEIVWRNAADSTDVKVKIGTNDQLQIDGVDVVGIMLIDNLNSSSTTAGLTANQGRILNDLINSGGAADGLSDVVLKSNIEKNGGDYPINDQLSLSSAIVSKSKVTGTITSDYTSTELVVVITMETTPPVTPFILQVYDPTASGTSDLVYIDSINSGSHPGPVTYDCADIGNTYLAIDVPVVTSSGLQIGDSVANLDETLNANDAINDSYHITKSRFKIAPFSADMDWSQRSFNTSFAVESTTATTIVLTDEAASAGASRRDIFLSGDKIMFFPKLWNGLSFDPVYDSTIGNNFKEITLTANATWATDQITLTHASGDNNHALTTTDFSVIRKSVHFLFSGKDGSSTETATEPTVDTFFPVSRGSFGTFTDSFTRANENPVASNGWSQINATTQITSNNLLMNDAANNLAAIKRSKENYVKANLPVELYLETEDVAGNQYGLIATYGTDGTGTVQQAAGGIGVAWNEAGPRWDFYVDGTNVANHPFTEPDASDQVYLRIQFHKSKILLKVWNVTDGESEPNTWVEYDNEADFTVFDGDLLVLGSYNGGSTHSTGVQTMTVSPVDQGFISKGTVSGLTVVEQITGFTQIERNDAKDKPLIFQRDIKLKET